MILFFSKKDYEILPKVVGSLVILMQDENVAIKKKVILSASSMYKSTLKVIITKYIKALLRNMF